jgi:hypothetical protein
MKLYEPYFVESISQKTAGNYKYVFDVIPPLSKTNNRYDENFYYELHITTIENHIDYNDFLQSYIHIEFIDNETIEIYEGEHYEESSTNGPFKIELIKLEKLEKKSKSEWKLKFINLKRDFEKLVDFKLNDYSQVRNEVIENYRKIYDKSLINLHEFGLNEDEINNPYIFRMLYTLFNGNSAKDSLNKLIDPDYYNPKQFKSWQQDFEKLDVKYRNLKEIDVSDYEKIRDHIVEIYKRTYQHMIPSLSYNYPNIDEIKYNLFFDFLMTKLRETE